MDYLGGAFLWNPAFTDEQLIQELEECLNKLNLLEEQDAGPFDDIKPFITLYAVTLGRKLINGIPLSVVL